MSTAFRETNNLYGLLVIRNEKDRYLADCINWMRPFLDGIFVFDDQSTDGSELIASRLGCEVVVRDDSIPSFLEHEGQFRMAAWRAFEEKMKPKFGDWVLAFDADEFLVCTSGNVRQHLVSAINDACDSVGVLLPFPEIFGVQHGVPMVRVDGLWGSIRGSRLFKYLPDAKWRDKPMGCGSEPTYVTWQGLSHRNHNLHVLHYGYARQTDVRAKYERYSSLLDHGHADAHIASIISSPTLVPWHGPIPKVRV